MGTFNTRAVIKEDAILLGELATAYTTAYSLQRGAFPEIATRGAGRGV